jgi:hypothetical protein
MYNALPLLGSDRFSYLHESVANKTLLDELGNWRPVRNKFKDGGYFEAYHVHIDKTEPKDDYDDRNALYGLWVISVASSEAHTPLTLGLLGNITYMLLHCFQTRKSFFRCKLRYAQATLSLHLSMLMRFNQGR